MCKVLLFLLFFTSCTLSANKAGIVPPDVFAETTDTALHNQNGSWIWRGEKLNGYIIEKKEGKITAKLPVINGKENGTALGWFENGHKKYERNFLNGKREGYQKGWYPNDSLAFIHFFKDDLFEGEQKTFYESGHPWQSLHYVKGYEEGKQKSWSDSGRVVNNFTVKNGKLYGVIGRYDCMSVYKK